MANQVNLFTQADWERLQTAKRILHDLVPKIDKVAQCGIECEGYREIQKQALQDLLRIEQLYFQDFTRGI